MLIYLTALEKYPRLHQHSLSALRNILFDLKISAIVWETAMSRVHIFFFLLNSLAIFFTVKLQIKNSMLNFNVNLRPLFQTFQSKRSLCIVIWVNFKTMNIYKRWQNDLFFCISVPPLCDVLYSSFDINLSWTKIINNYHCYFHNITVSHRHCKSLC